MRAETATITVLVTTDLHGNLLGYDYYTAQSVPRGLARIATLIKAQRASAPDALLLDVGDTIQGAPLESVYQQYVRTGHFPLNLQPETPLSIDPMMQAMNRLGYQAMVPGNHEFNFGISNLQRARTRAQFPWISANIEATGLPTAPAYASHITKMVQGVKIAVVGVTTPAIPVWEKPENYVGYRFAEPLAAVRRTVQHLQNTDKPDIILVAAHAGLGRDPQTGKPYPNELPGENFVYDLAAQIPGITAIFFGHTHRQVIHQQVNGVELIQARNWGMSLARLQLRLTRESGSWRMVDRQATLLPVTADTPEDAEIAKLASPYHEITERYLNTPVAKAPVPLDGALGRVQDSALLDAIHQVQLTYGKANVSFTSLFNPRVTVPPGTLTVRQLAALYIYDNELYVVDGNGRMVREALENAARYFNPCLDAECSGPLIGKEMPGFNFDMAQGVEYDIDLTRPTGQRITKLLYQGKPLRDEQPLRIALNNYRAGGSGGYGMFRAAPIVFRSGKEIRDLLIEYYTQKGQLPATPDHNWRILPEAAHRRLVEEARAEAGRPSTQ